MLSWTHASLSQPALLKNEPVVQLYIRYCGVTLGRWKNSSSVCSKARCSIHQDPSFSFPLTSITSPLPLKWINDLSISKNNYLHYVSICVHFISMGRTLDLDQCFIDLKLRWGVLTWNEICVSLGLFWVLWCRRGSG